MFPFAAWPAGIAFLLLPSLAWILADHSVWDAEASAYGRQSLAMWSSLRGDNDEPWAWLMLHFQTQRAPGVSWLTQGFAALFFLTGDATQALLMSTGVAHALALGAIAATARVLYPHRVMPAWMSMFFVAAGPLFVDAGHRYGAEPWQLLVVALFYLMAAKARDLNPVELLCGLVILSAWAMLVHVTTPIHVILPGLWSVGVLFEAIRKKRPALPDARVRAAFLLCVAVASAIGALAVYALHGKELLAQGQTQGGGLPGHGLHGLLRLLQDYWLPGTGLAFLLAWAGAKAWPSREPRGFSMPGPTVRPVLLGIALLQIGGVLVYSGMGGEGMDHSWHALAPATAMWVAAMAHAVRRTKAPWILAGILALQWGLAHGQAWGLQTARLLRAHPPARVIDRHGIALAEIHRLLDMTAYDGEQEARIVAVSVPWLSSHTLNFYSSARVYDGKSFCLFSTIGYMRRDVRDALDLLSERDPRFVISLRRNVIGQETDTPVTVGESLRQWLERSPHYRRVPLESTAGILLFERIRPTPKIP